MKTKKQKRQTALHAEAKRARKEGKVVGFASGKKGVIFGVVGLVARKRMLTAAQAAEALGITRGAAQVRLWRSAMAGRLIVTEKDGTKIYSVANAKSKSRPHAARKRKGGVAGPDATFRPDLTRRNGKSTAECSTSASPVRIQERSRRQRSSGHSGW